MSVRRCFDVCPSAYHSAFAMQYEECGHSVSMLLASTDDDGSSDVFRRPEKKLRYGFHAIRGKRQPRQRLSPRGFMSNTPWIKPLTADTLRAGIFRSIAPYTVLLVVRFMLRSYRIRYSAALRRAACCVVCAAIRRTTEKPVGGTSLVVHAIKFAYDAGNDE